MNLQGRGGKSSGGRAAGPYKDISLQQKVAASAKEGLYADESYAPKRGKKTTQQSARESLSLVAAKSKSAGSVTPKARTKVKKQEAVAYGLGDDLHHRSQRVNENDEADAYAESDDLDGDGDSVVASERQGAKDMTTRATGASRGMEDEGGQVEHGSKGRRPIAQGAKPAQRRTPGAGKRPVNSTLPQPSIPPASLSRAAAARTAPRSAIATAGTPQPPRLSPATLAIPARTEENSYTVGGGGAGGVEAEEDGPRRRPVNGVSSSRAKGAAASGAVARRGGGPAANVRKPLPPTAPASAPVPSR